MSIAKSKIVKCEICGIKMYARGLHSHIRQKHLLVVKTVTKVIPDDYSATIVAKAVDFSYKPEILNSVTVDKDVDLDACDGVEKIAIIRSCYRCNKPIELKMMFAENYSYANAPRIDFVCDCCIQTFYDLPGCLVRGGKLDKGGFFL